MGASNNAIVIVSGKWTETNCQHIFTKYIDIKYQMHSDTDESIQSSHTCKAIITFHGFNSVEKIQYNRQ